jgi:DNA polymerase-3 subunit alpha
MEECRRMGLEVLPPDVNESDGTFTVVGGKIRFGLQAIKNVGVGPVEQILSARSEGGRFTSLADFVSRVDPRAVNKRALESMIAAGAFDSLHANRRAMNEVLEAMIAYGQMVQRDSHTVDMFGGGVDQTRKAPDIPEVEDLPLAMRLNAEKEMLGFYVSGHPLTRYRRELARFASRTSQKITAADEGKEARVGGIIQAIKTIPDKRGNLMAFVTIEDFGGSLELILFSDSFEKAKEHIRVDGIILASGRISTREGQAPKLLTSNVVPLDRLTDFYDCRLVLQFDREDLPRIGEIRPILEAHPGEKDVIILTRKNGEELQIRPRNLRVSLQNDILEDLRRVLGESKVYLAPVGSL